MTIGEKRVTIHKLLFKMGALESKTDLLRSYGVKSTTELSEQTIDEIIARLKYGVTNRYAASDELKQQRSRALVLINKCGIYATNNDWTAVNRFMLDSRIAGKLLYELSVEEIKTLCKKLRLIADKKAAQDKHNVLHISLN